MVEYKNIGGKNFPFSDLQAHDLKNAAAHREYMLQKGIDEFLFKAFSVTRVNKVPGDYLEFGCGSTIRSFRFALKYNRFEPANRMLYAFDSFEGLPEIRPEDHAQWTTGALAVSREQFQEVLSHYGAKEGADYRTVPGYYDQTLGARTPADYGIKAAAIVHVDCDLYQSTVPVLEFVTPILQTGSILSFDDWFCENGDPKRGEQRAFHEWREGSGRHLHLAQYQTFGWHGMSFIITKD